MDLSEGEGALAEYTCERCEGWGKLQPNGEPYPQDIEPATLQLTDGELLCPVCKGVGLVRIPV